MYTTESIDRLFLELSQFTQATTAKELSLAAEVKTLRSAMKPFADLVATTSGRIPHERLSAADWHSLAKAYGPNDQAVRRAESASETSAELGEGD